MSHVGLVDIRGPDRTCDPVRLSHLSHGYEGHEKEDRAMRDISYLGDKH